MYRVFLGLAILGSAMLLASNIIGVTSKRISKELFNLHFLLGVFTAMYLCLVHIICMFHLIGSGKDIKEAAEKLREYPDILAELKYLKKKVFPLATLAILIAVASELSGGGVHTKSIPDFIHLTLGVIALLFNLYVFYVEYDAVRHNYLVMCMVDIKLDQESSKGPSPQA